MAKVYALMEFIGEDGVKHEPGEEFDFPRETRRQKFDYETYLQRGVISTRKPDTKDEDEGAQRTRKGRG